MRVERLNATELNSLAESSSEEIKLVENETGRKTYQQKAAEKNYYQDGDGRWWEKSEFGSDFDERVDSFGLDVEYPDLADRTEELAEKYGVDFSDSSGWGFKSRIYENAETLKDSSDNHLDNIFMVRMAITTAISGTEAKLVSYNEEELDKLTDCLGEYYQEVTRMIPGNKIPREVGSVAEYFVRNYNEKLVEGDFLQKMAEFTAVACNSEQYRGKALILQGVEYGIEGLSKNEDSGRLFGAYMDYYSELLGDERKITRYDTRSQVFARYVRSHGMNDDTISGFRDEIFPLLEQRDAVVLPILEGGNAYGTMPGAYGIADYTEECLLSRFEPASINKLLRIYYEIPTSDYAKFEQNRKDAARLQGTIIGGRDFIHDERIGAHEVLSAIKDYYEHREMEEEEYRRNLEELEERYRFGVLPNALNLDAYEKPIVYMSDNNSASLGSPNERAIDILNRLVENTAPMVLGVPETGNFKLDALLSQIEPIANRETGEVKVDIKDVGPAVTEMNNMLIERAGEQGVYPSTVSAIAYLDKMSSYALRGCNRKELLELPFDPNFKEIVRFSQLTSSVEYSEREFEEKYREILDRASEAYGGEQVDSYKVKDAYHVLSRWMVENVARLSKNYNKKTTERFKEATWSGNLSDSLIGLFEGA